MSFHSTSAVNKITSWQLQIMERFVAIFETCSVTNVTGIFTSSNTSDWEYEYFEYQQNNKQVNYLSSFVYKQT